MEKVCILLVLVTKEVKSLHCTAVTNKQTDNKLKGYVLRSISNNVTR